MNMKVLVLCDDRWHPAATVRNGLAPLEQRGFTFDFMEDATDWSAQKMSQYPVVILSKSNDVSSSNYDNWMTPEIEVAFQDYVRGGNGLLVIHSGSAGYKETPILRKLVGGVFAHHPAQCDVTIVPRDGHPNVVAWWNLLRQIKAAHRHCYFRALSYLKSQWRGTTCTECPLDFF